MRNINIEFNYDDYLSHVLSGARDTEANQKQWLDLVAVINRESWLEIMHSEVLETVQMANRSEGNL